MQSMKPLPLGGASIAFGCTLVEEITRKNTAEQESWIYYRDISLMGTPVEAEKAQEAELGEGETISSDEALTTASATTAANTGPAA